MSRRHKYLQIENKTHNIRNRRTRQTPITNICGRERETMLITPQLLHKLSSFYQACNFWPSSRLFGHCFCHIWIKILLINWCLPYIEEYAILLYIYEEPFLLPCQQFHFPKFRRCLWFNPKLCYCLVLLTGCIKIWYRTLNIVYLDQWRHFSRG